MKTIYLLVAFTFLGISCEKGLKLRTSVSGKVIDFGSGDPIENVKVYLKDGIDGSGPFTESDFTTDAEDFGLTTSSGEFDLMVRGLYSAFLYPVKGDDYYLFDLGNGVITTSANAYDNGKTYPDEIIKLKAKAYQDVTILSKETAPDSAIIYSYLTNLNELSGRIQGFDTEFDFSGTLAVGNQHYKYKIEYKRAGAWNEIVDSFYVAKGETYIDTIFF